MITGTLWVTKYERASRSPPAFEEEYGLFGESGDFSVKEPFFMLP